MSVTIPTLILKQLYTFGSLENIEGGIQFSLKNRLSDTRVLAVKSVAINGREMPLGAILLDFGDNAPRKITPTFEPIDFPLAKVVTFIIHTDHLPEGKHSIEITVEAEMFGELNIAVEDSITTQDEHLVRIPRDSTDDYSPDIIKERQAFVEEFSGKKLEHLPHYSFDPHITKGNIEHFVGVAQIPIGFAGPIHINGEHAQGEFIVPLATTEGTLVASYNRGMKVINLSGGARCTVVGDAMQRAPVFVFNNALEGREFLKWVNDHIDNIRTEAEATSSVAKLQYIDPYLSNKFVFLRFNYSTGDAAGQNMVGRATFAACSWILDQYPEPIQHFYLESNFATDKKASQVNIMRTRGKRVTAEATIKRDVLNHVMRVEPSSLHRHSQVANVGAFLSGANNNGCHSPNAITAMFIATGQDVANVAESSAGVVYTELTNDGDLYISITIPSLIIATYGGGTGLATQRECLEIMGCYGRGKVNKLAEIIAGVVLAGELSLAAAISSSDWVSSHEQYGRNR
ncbi:MAG: hydroxymethylglutaryl-CoA reductase [Phototrophicales bacterium]|nr:MAG: hydroxymethylglutaryl-CoA reductase [Phototrophicales bacterium]